MIYRFRKQKGLIVSSIFGVLVLWGTFLYIALWGNAPIGGLIAIGLLFSLIIVIGLRTPRYFYIEKDLIIVKLYLGRKVLTSTFAPQQENGGRFRGCFGLLYWKEVWVSG